MKCAMLLIDEHNIHEYLRQRDWFPEGIQQVEPLSGGVSNVVLRINSPKCTAVFKQSRGQLRTRDDWFSDLDRIYREQEVMQMLHP